MSIGVSCPKASDNITVHLLSSQQTICVAGTYSSKLTFLQRLAAAPRALFSWLLRLFSGQPAHSTTTVQVIRVRVVSGPFTMTPSPNPKLSTDCDISPPKSPWCCNAIQLPSASGSSTQFTAFAWLLASTSGSIIDGPHTVTFTAGGSGSTIDCCASRAFGHTNPGLAAELGSHPRLEVAVPDGPNAGLHEATDVSHLKWAVTIGGVTYGVACDAGAALVIRGPATSATARSVERSPFSATFPGRVFGASGDVVVTKA
jgi:hypothetical protein